MSDVAVGLISVAGMLVLIYGGMHIALAVAVVSVAGVWWLRDSLNVALALLQQAAVDGLADHLFGVVPLFVLMGMLVNAADIGRARRAWAVADAELIVNPDGAANQVEGGVVQAISWTLHEAVAWDAERILTRGWDSYPILRFDQVPEIVVELVDRPEQQSAGLGECATGPTAAALGNAVARALGVRLRDMPLTPERIATAAAS